jgi:hypothetical protein
MARGVRVLRAGYWWLRCGMAWKGDPFGKERRLTFPASHKSALPSHDYGDARREGNNAPPGLYVLRLHYF